MRSILTAIVSFFNFAARQRERLDAERIERMLERKHQLKMLETFFAQMIAFSAKQNESVIELARAQSAQADAFHAWIKGFQAPAGEPQPSAVIREEDEWAAERARETGFPAHLPPEFQLAATLERLNQQALGDFDREGSDF